jgi:hypothetical protein
MTRAWDRKTVARAAGWMLALTLAGMGVWLMSTERPARNRPLRIPPAAAQRPSHRSVAGTEETAFQRARRRIISPSSTATGAAVTQEASRSAAEAGLRNSAQQVQLPAERDGTFADLYETWRSEQEDSAATHAAMNWLEDRLLGLGLAPAAAYLSCRTSLCRLGLGFERMQDLRRLRELQLPPGIEPKVSEVYEYPHLRAVVIYWTPSGSDWDAVQ